MINLSVNIGFVDSTRNSHIIPLNELHKLTGREWFDFDYSFINLDKCEPNLKEFLKDPLEILKKVEIKYMNKDVGCGLFATADIPEGTVIGFITGEQKKLQSSSVDFDPQNPTALIQSGQISYDDDGNIYIIDSSKKSNHTHYIQHLPSIKALQDLNINNIDDIAICNLSEHTLQHNGFELTYFCTTRKILQNEIIGCPYQTNEKERALSEYSLFRRTGELINPPEYLNTNNRLCK